MNPGGSVKDRTALWMVEDAERRGIIKERCTLIEASGGNTGSALAMIAAVKGYKAAITMPLIISVEK